MKQLDKKLQSIDLIYWILWYINAPPKVDLMFKNPQIKSRSRQGYATRGEICRFITRVLGIPISHRTIDRRLAELVDKGFIEKVTTGVYKITDKGKDEAMFFDAGLRMRYKIMYGVKGKVNILINIGSGDDINILVRLTGQVAKLVKSALESKLRHMSREDIFEAALQRELQLLYELIGFAVLMYLFGLHDNVVNLIKEKIHNWEEVSTCFDEILNEILGELEKHGLMKNKDSF